MSTSILINSCFLSEIFEASAYIYYQIQHKLLCIKTLFSKKISFSFPFLKGNGSNDTTAYAIPSENNYQEAEGLVLGQESSNKVPQETSYPPSPDIIITNENYDDKFQQLTVESPHTEKVNFCIDHHNHKKLTDTEVTVYLLIIERCSLQLFMKDIYNSCNISIMYIYDFH